MDIVMPSLGADMEEGTLIEWLIKVGDTIKKGDIIAVIETQKGAIDMETFDDGVITSLLLQPVITVPVGTVMATLSSVEETTDTPNEPLIDKSLNNSPLSSKSLTSKPLSANSLRSESLSTESLSNKPLSNKVSPIARKLAAQENIDLSTLTGSGPDGAVVLRDLPKIDKRKGDQDRLSGMRQSIALAMEKSKREIPHYYLMLDVNISKALHYIRSHNEQVEPEQRLLLLALLLRATALALKKFPQFNGFYQNGQFITSDNIHIGNAISIRNGGLVVPAIHSLDKLSLIETMDALRDVTMRSRSGHLRSSELSDATVTVTNLGERGANVVMGVIYPPQVAIVGFGKPTPSAIVVDNNIVVADILTISLSADHRASDGIVGAKFLDTLASYLQNPEIL